MEHKKDGMMDNRKVSDNHQQGIERVKQRDHEKREGHDGKMSGKGSANWSRSRSGMTPRKA